ncbi:MAG TPA: cytochrome C oxidase subunit IV family protein [Chitinophagaceae bacterium]|nr:cytochrome C oxidase subunit IV family protein [Chitinophagaceae bacterium]
MDNIHATGELHHDDAHTFDTKAIWKTFRILLYITVFELILAIGYYEMTFSNPGLVKHILNGIFIILTLAKAFFIIAEFMHLGHELRNLIMTIAIPALLFLWFIGAFLWDGTSYKNLRNNYDRNHREQSQQKVEVKEGHGEHHEAKKPGSNE